MKKTVAIETEATDLQENHAQSTRERIDQTLRNMNTKMIQLFKFDFSYFRSLKVVPPQEFQSQLAQRMQNDLEESGAANSSIQWRQIFEILARDQAAGLSEHFAFYNPRNDTLYLNEKMVRKYPERVISVCAHELAEKLLSSYISLPPKASMQSAVNLYFEEKKNDDPERLHQIIDVYVDTVFRAVFKEGCCEAMAVQVMRNMNYAAEAASLEKELQAGYPKCIGLLSRIENAKNAANAKTVQPNRKVLDAQVIVEEVLKNAQIIKGVSYYLGYPLARAVLGKCGLEGIRFAIEYAPPLKAEYFANPPSYLFTIEKCYFLNKDR